MATVRKRQWKSRAGDACSWVVSWTDPTDGKRKTKSFAEGEKRQADTFRKKVQQDPTYACKAKDVSVADVCERYLRIYEQRYRDKEITRCTLNQAWVAVDNHIIPFIGKVIATNLTPLMVSDWITALRSAKDNPRSALVLRKTVETLRAALTEAQRLELIKRNVLKDVPPRLPKKPDGKITIPSKAQVQSLLTAADTGKKPILPVVIALAAFTGMRAGEIFGLVWRNINLEKRTIDVQQIVDRYGDIQKRTKTKAGFRTIPISQMLVARLRNWRVLTGRSEDDLVFFTKQSLRMRRGLVPYTSQTFRGTWIGLLKSAGLYDKNDPLHFHSLRHVAASLLIEQKLPPKQIQTIMGHASIQMTFDRYGHLFDDEGVAHRASDNIGRQFQLGVVAHG